MPRALFYILATLTLTALCSCESRATKVWYRRGDYGGQGLRVEYLLKKRLAVDESEPWLPENESVPWQLEYAVFLRDTAGKANFVGNLPTPYLSRNGDTEVPLEYSPGGHYWVTADGVITPMEEHLPAGLYVSLNELAAQAKERGFDQCRTYGAAIRYLRLVYSQLPKQPPKTSK